MGCCVVGVLFVWGGGVGGGGVGKKVSLIMVRIYLNGRKLTVTKIKWGGARLLEFLGHFLGKRFEGAGVQNLKKKNYQPLNSPHACPWCRN